ncbi:uncharacterized protein TNCT_72451 [Trichonephila clavata]|uniref:Uncharacterized protein n=1 Tax=Trichonephila clavata TaxID=2740835 RepID=A0A8X6J7C1_TRICU|nr:uncharacterized protein TNCT_72451 [Trichonephila clavata]
MNYQEDPGRMQLLYANQDALSNPYLSLGRPMCGELTITDLFAFIVEDQATWFVTAVSDELFSTHTEAAKQAAVSYHPLTCHLTNAAGKRLEHHHLFQAGEDHQYAAIDHPLPMANVVPAAETRKTK